MRLVTRFFAKWETLVLDKGWEISFRIHNASRGVEPSLKFDIELLGNPPILFTQYLFQEDEID